MSTVSKFMIVITVIVLSAVADIPILPVDLVSEAEAVFGVRRRTARRTAVVAYSAGAASASAAAQQQAPPPQQTAPAQETAQQQAPPPPQQVSAVPVGTIAQALPGGCTPVTVGNVQYQKCEEVFYRTAFQGNSLVYVVVDKPL